MKDTLGQNLERVSTLVTISHPSRLTTCGVNSLHEQFTWIKMAELWASLVEQQRRLEDGDERCVMYLRQSAVQKHPGTARCYRNGCSMFTRSFQNTVNTHLMEHCDSQILDTSLQPGAMYLNGSQSALEKQWRKKWGWGSTGNWRTKREWEKDTETTRTSQVLLRMWCFSSVCISLHGHRGYLGSEAVDDSFLSHCSSNKINKWNY